MVNTTRLVCGASIAVLLLAAVPAPAQRIQFPSATPPGGIGPTPGPTAALEGNIQLPPSGWDPYATPGTQPPSLFPQDPYLSSPYPQGASQGYVATMQRFLQEVRLDYHWFAGHGPRELGINDAELTATFAIPMFRSQQTPLLITPGFAAHFFEGPVVTPATGTADLPAHVFDAYLDSAWNPEITPWLGGELGIRIGVYSDFTKVTAESIRYIGHGLAVISLTPQFKIKAGVFYLDRNLIKILPAGGLVWMPNSDIQFDILFPNPKFSKRLTTFRDTEWWIYVRGEYGGNAWTINRVPAALVGTDPQFQRVDYNDIRVALGVEFERLTGGFNGLFEVGVACDRQIYYVSQTPEYNPRTTFFLRGGVAY